MQKDDTNTKPEPIPVWEGCLAVDADGDRWRILAASGGHVARIRHPYAGGVREGRPADLVPDLADPDTRAAYDRRLAIALGCPEEVACEGVTIILREMEDMRIVGGTTSYGMWEWTDGGVIETRDPLLARALAWPADKRQP